MHSPFHHRRKNGHITRATPARTSAAPAQRPPVLTMATVLKRGRVSLDMVDLTGEPRLVKPKRRRQLLSLIHI